MTRPRYPMFDESPEDLDDYEDSFITGIDYSEDAAELQPHPDTMPEPFTTDELQRIFAPAGVRVRRIF